MWILIACIVLIVIFLLVLACLRMSGQSNEEQYPRTEADRKLVKMLKVFIV